MNTIKSTIPIRLCFSEITPESAENGELSDSGIEWESEDSFKELVYRMKKDFSENSGHWLSTGFFISDYDTLTEREETLHPADNSPRTMRYWRKALLAAGYL